MSPICYYQTVWRIRSRRNVIASDVARLKLDNTFICVCETCVKVMHLSVRRWERCRGMISNRRDGTARTHRAHIAAIAMIHCVVHLWMKMNLIWRITASVLLIWSVIHINCKLLPRLRPFAVSLLPRATFQRPRNDVQMTEVPLQLRVSGSYLLEILQSVW